jgi:hypothetical protein
MDPSINLGTPPESRVCTVECRFNPFTCPAAVGTIFEFRETSTATPLRFLIDGIGFRALPEQAPHALTVRARPSLAAFA